MTQHVAGVTMVLVLGWEHVILGATWDQITSTLAMLAIGISPIVRVSSVRNRAKGVGWYLLLVILCLISSTVCQCNGHSTCPINSSMCNQPCGNMTQGEKCERCVPGYYGIAINGGTCNRKC